MLIVEDKITIKQKNVLSGG